jgi:hypothetical protein
MQAKHLKTASQIVFNDAEGTSQYKSLYLGTLGPEAVRCVLMHAMCLHAAAVLLQKAHWPHTAVNVLLLMQASHHNMMHHNKTMHAGAALQTVLHMMPAAAARQRKGMLMAWVLQTSVGLHQQCTR